MLQCMLLTRRRLLQGVALGTIAAGLPRSTWASTARALSLPELVGTCRFALVGTTTEVSSRWETVGDSRRIVSYHEVQVAYPIDGRPPAETNLVVRTLGGRVGSIGQLVHGEAKLELDVPSVLFLSPSRDGILGVTAMAQGHYPLRADADRVLRLQPSPNIPELVNRPGSAVERLVRRSVPEAEALVFESMPSRP
jgi:hypothetical protein